MAQVNRIPRGFLDFVGAQTGGKNPPVTENAVSPTIEMTPFYQAQTLAGVNDTVAHTVVGSSLNVAVPEGETWLLFAASIRTTYPANSFDQWELTLNELPRGNVIDLASFPAIWSTRVLGNLAVPGQRDIDSVSFPTPYPLSAGTIIRATTTQRDTLGVSRTARIQYVIAQYRG